MVLVSPAYVASRRGARNSPLLRTPRPAQLPAVGGQRAWRSVQLRSIAGVVDRRVPRGRCFGRFRAAVPCYSASRGLTWMVRNRLLTHYAWQHGAPRSVGLTVTLQLQAVSRRSGRRVPAKCRYACVCICRPEASALPLASGRLHACPNCTFPMRVAHGAPDSLEYVRACSQSTS